MENLLSLDSVANYEKLHRIGEGTYGVVYKARDRTTGQIVALKKVRFDKARDGVPVTSIRELRVLQQCQHPNIVRLMKVVTGSKADSVFFVFEYCDYDLGRVLDSMDQPFTLAQVKTLMMQLLDAVAHLHARWVLHRDIKMSNLLYCKTGHLKLCDLGLARSFQHVPHPMTPRVVTLWYRAPEVLMGYEEYGPAIDMWSVGCILGELLSHQPLFPARTELEALRMQVDLLGSPDDRTWPGLQSLPYAKMFKLPSQPVNHLHRITEPHRHTARPNTEAPGHNHRSRHDEHHEKQHYVRGHSSDYEHDGQSPLQYKDSHVLQDKQVDHNRGRHNPDRWEHDRHRARSASPSVRRHEHHQYARSSDARRSRSRSRSPKHKHRDRHARSQSRDRRGHRSRSRSRSRRHRSRSPARRSRSRSRDSMRQDRSSRRAGSDGHEDLALDLLSKLLAWDPATRLTAQQARGHAWFKEHPLPCELSAMPSSPVKDHILHGTHQHHQQQAHSDRPAQHNNYSHAAATHAGAALKTYSAHHQGSNLLRDKVARQIQAARMSDAFGYKPNKR